MIFSRVPFLASSALSDAVPSADEQCFWVDENDNVVCTDAGHQTVLSHILTFWIDEDANRGM